MTRGDIVVVQRSKRDRCYSRVVGATDAYVVVDFCGCSIVFGREDIRRAPMAVQDRRMMR